MQATEISEVADQVRALPANGAARERQLHRLIELHAFAEAAASLHAASIRTRDDRSVLSRVLASAEAVVGDALAQPAIPTDDAVRDTLRDAVSSPEFLATVTGWIRELRSTAALRPDSGSCTVASALELWLWTMNHFSEDVLVTKVVDELAEVVAPLVAARCFALEVTTKVTPGEETLRADLSHIYAAHAASTAAAVCAEIVYGYRRHLMWDAEGCSTCFVGEDLDELEGLIPGIASGTRMSADVIEASGAHAAKRGPCANSNGVETFVQLRNRLDGCLTGSRVAKERAAVAIANTMKGRA